MNQYEQFIISRITPPQDIYLYINHLEQNANHTNKIMVSSSHELKTTADSN